ncbi:hypothetical protein ACQ4PT_030005 [Festuca glaucescens]
METRTLAEVRAADADTLFSLYFPEGRVSAAAAVGCVCIDYLTCRECERILGQSFLAIELAARKKPRTDPPVLVARVDAGPGQRLAPGSHRLEGHDAAVSGMADRLVVGSHSHPLSDGVEGSDAGASMAERLVPGSHPPSDGVEESDAATSSMADRQGPGSDPPSHGVEGFEAAISVMAARFGLSAAVGERAKEVFRKMDEARAWHHGRGWTMDRSKGPLAYAACLSIACRTEGSALSLRELARAASVDGGAATRKDIAKLIGQIRRRLGEEEAGQSTGIGMVCVSTYVRRFGALVGLREAESAAALKAARLLEDGVLDVRHNADIMASAVVCMARQRAGAIRPGVKDVAAATGVSNMTIYAACRELRPHAELLFG